MWALSSPHIPLFVINYQLVLVVIAKSKGQLKLFWLSTLTVWSWTRFRRLLILDQQDPDIFKSASFHKDFAFECCNVHQKGPKEWAKTEPRVKKFNRHSMAAFIGCWFYDVDVTYISGIPLILHNSSFRSFESVRKIKEKLIFRAICYDLDKYTQLLLYH